MTSVAAGIGLVCAVGLNMAAVVVRQTPPPPTVKPPLQTSAKATEAEITVTGCLVQGSAPNVFLLQNAKRDPQSAAEKPARYVVAPATEDLFLKQHLNHQVRILGVPDGKPQPTPQAGAAVDEKLVPTLNAKSLTMVSASCGAGFSQVGPSDLDQESGSESEVEESVNGTTPAPSHVFDGTADRVPSPPGTVPTSQAIEAVKDRVPVRATTTDLIGDEVPAKPLTMAPATLDAPPAVNPEPGTLLLIASGLLLVVYAGRDREWHVFRRRRPAR